MLNKITDCAQQNTTLSKLETDEKKQVQNTNKSNGIEFRRTISIFNKKYHYAFLFGEDNNTENKSSFIGLLFLLITLFVLIISMSIGLFIIIYLIKSAVGIDIFDHYSLGLWDWFRTKIIHTK